MNPRDLSADQLRQLLIEKTRNQRRSRLDQFKKTGRVLMVDQPVGPRALNLDQTADESSSRRAKPARRQGISRLLLVVEVIAVVALVLVVFSGISLLRDLNRQVSKSLQQPTPSPTPLVYAVILPSGHTPPDALEDTRFNEAEIPENLMPLVQSYAALPVPTSSPGNPIRIRIPTIKVDAPVVQGDGWEQLKKGVGQHIGSANPGQPSNLVLSAHNDIFGEIFRDLDQLASGDEVLVSTSLQTYTYVVKQTQIVEPTAVEVMAPTQNGVVTLISCYPYLIDNKRIVVTAELVANP